MVHIRLAQLTKTYANGARGAVDVEMAVDAGQWLTLVGPSGSGKTTLLRLVAGLERPSAGSIHFNQRDVTALAPRRRDLAMVFQHPSLYPHLSVFENIAFGLRMRGGRGEAVAGEVRRAAELVGVAPLLQRRPRELSGGEAQRVSLARAIARRPACFLFDEPLASLDAPLRAQLRRELRSFHAALGVTVIYVTHDQDEAIALSDRVAVIHEGRIRQVGTADDVYQTPADGWVARFFGAAPMNLFRGALSRSDGRRRFRSAALECDWAAAGAHCDADAAEVVLGIRPEDLAIGSAPPRDHPGPRPEGVRLTGRVRDVERTAGGVVVLCDAADGTAFAVRCAAPCSCAPGEEAAFVAPRDRVHRFTADPSEPCGAGRRLGPLPAV